jgi:hypothetical protein
VSYPQPDADEYAKKGVYDVFPLSTPLASPGDIYESPQSSHGVAVGSDSDIANVNVAFFDDQATPTHLRTVTISPQRAFTGLIAARGDARYLPSQIPGRVLFWAQDVFDPAFRPRAFNASTDSIEFIAPKLQVLQYFHPPNSLGPARADKSFSFQNYRVLGAMTAYIVVPYYGRRYGYVQFTNRNTLAGNSFGILGVNFCITQNSSSNPYTQEKVIRAPANVAPGNSAEQIITARTHGLFDVLVLSVTEAGPAPLRVILSDVDQGG